MREKYRKAHRIQMKMGKSSNTKSITGKVISRRIGNVYSTRNTVDISILELG